MCNATINWEGEPYLYARKIYSKPFNNLSEFYDSYNLNSKNIRDSYLTHVLTDDTPESYFEFITLYIIGEQFYLFWHVNYNDCIIIYDQVRLEALFADTKFLFGRTLAPKFRTKHGN